MAIYTPSISNQNSLGGVGSQAVVLSSTMDINKFTQQANSDQLVLTSIFITILNNDASQLSQPITLVRLDATGNSKSVVIIPKLDSYALHIQADNIPVDFKFDGLSKFEYPILSGNSVKLKLILGVKDVYNDTVKKVFGYDKISIEDALNAEIGLLREPGEQTQIFLPKQPISELKEPEEKTNVPILKTLPISLAKLNEPEEVVKPPIVEMPIISELKEPEEIKKKIGAKTTKPSVKEVKKEEIKQIKLSTNYMNLFILLTLTVSALYVYSLSKDKT